MKHPIKNSSKSLFCSKALLAGSMLATVGVLAGCSGGSTSSGSGSNPSPTPTPAAKTVVQVNMGDSPADWMLAFSMNISSMTLTGTNGSATVVSSSMPMEMMHLMGTMQPLAMVSAPQGTYSGATITIASATAMYMDPTTKSPMQKTITGPITGSITFGTPITVGSTPMAMSFDVDMAKSVTVDSNGNLSMNPVIKVTSGTQGSGNPMDFANGGIQRMMGVVSSVSGSSFTMTSMQAAQSFTFMTNSSTTFANGSMGSMSTGMNVMVDATMQADGTLMATRIQSMMNQNGVMGGGIITAIAGQPPTSLTMVMQNGAGMGMMASYFADGVTINLNSNAAFSIDHDNIDMSGLPFTPTFDNVHIYVGQSVMPVSTSGMMSGGGMGGGMMGGSSMAGSITASNLQLEPQGLSGIVASSISAGSTSSFTMTLPSDSAFATLTGATTVKVYQQASTTVWGTSIASGSSAHVFGLLFYDGGQWKMVAARIAD